MHLTESLTITLTEREVMVLLHALSAYRREIRADVLEGRAGAREDLTEATDLRNKIRDAP